MQPRLARTRGKRWKKLLSEPRFRAGYDFLLLRSEEDPELKDLCDFWTQAQEETPPVPVADKPKSTRGNGRRRPRRRRKKVSAS
jgi:poly(A) polymerase